MTRNWTHQALAGEVPAAEGVLEHNRDLVEPLQLCHESLHACGMGVIADGALLDCLRRAATFGLFLGTPGRAPGLGPAMPPRWSEITEYLELGSYDEWDEKTRLEFLLEELNSRRPPAAGALPAFGGYRRGARHLPGDRRRTTGVAGVLRDLDGRPAVRRAGGATVAKGKRRRLADARGAAVRDPRRPGQRRPPAWSAC
ncbi:phosphoenolpyruvate carboxylase [Pseudomonas aeruginosa]|nr:phosphoenolpyruvate carboxylase [Pseudomonas aeruginosa]